MRLMNKKNSLTVFVGLLLFFVYLGSIYLLRRNFASATTILWWSMLFLLASLYFVRGINKKTNPKRIDYLGILTIVIAGLLTLQLNQPLFAPSISEFEKVENRTEYWINWPREIGSEEFNFKVYQYSNYEITVQPPLFPFNNHISIDSLFGSDSSMVYNDFFEIRGPIKFIKRNEKQELATLCDGFSVKSAKVFTKTLIELPFQDEIEIKLSHYEIAPWADLSEKELFFISDFAFSNRINLRRYFLSKEYKNEIIKKYNIDITDNSITFGELNEPDFFELEKCQIVIINRSKEDKLIKLRHNGLYPRHFFSTTNSGSESEEIINLHNGVIMVPSMQSKVLNVLEMKHRRHFNDIFP